MFDVLQSTRYWDTTLLKCVCPNFATSTKIVDLHGDAKSVLIKGLENHRSRKVKLRWKRTG